MEQKKLENQKETLVFLNSKYPECFVLNGAVKPLKIGIFQDLAADLAEAEFVSKRLLRLSLRHYTSSWRYLSAIKAGVPRVDLSGADGDAVEEQHAEHASEQLKESKAKAAKQRESKLKELKKPVKHKGYRSSQTGESKTQDKAGKTANKSNKRIQSDTNKNYTKKVHKPNVEVPIEQNELVVGHSALIKLGKEPMPVTITDISKDGVSVQLKSGMTVKVQSAQLYSSSQATIK